MEKGEVFLIYKLFIPFLVFMILVGCNIETNNNQFTFSYEMNSIEDEDKNEVQRWLNKPNQTPTRTYEVNDEINNRYYVYAHSKIYSEVDVEQTDDKVILTFKSKKNNSSLQDALIKIKYNPDKINSFVLKTE